MHHILTTQQFLDRPLLTKLFVSATKFEKLDRRRKVPPLLGGRILASLFYEPSTRTRFSFETAALKLGGQVISTENAGEFSSAMKGETLEDTVRVVGGYADVIVLRHPEVGSAQRAAAVSRVPIINAGDGAGEHPTQALLDLYTIHKELGRLDNLAVALVGDLKHGRTIHSLTHILTVCRNLKLWLVSPKTLRLPKQYRKFLKSKQIDFLETKELDGTIPQVDVIYMTRIQKERFASARAYSQVKNAYVINAKKLKRLRRDAIIMSPLPRISEITPDVDADPRAAYFRQAQNGLYIRLALLKWLLTK